MLRCLLLLGAAGCTGSEGCPQEVRIRYDDLDPEAQPLVDAVHELHAFLEVVGPTCIDQVLFSPVARPEGEAWREREGWKVVVPPNVDGTTVRWHVCAVLEQERGLLFGAPEELGVSESGFLEHCSRFPTSAGACAPEDPTAAWVRSATLMEDPWQQAPLVPVQHEPALDYTYSDWEETEGTLWADRGLAEVRSTEDALELRWLTPFGIEFESVPLGGLEPKGLLTDGGRLAMRQAPSDLWSPGVPARWRVADLDSGLQVQTPWLDEDWFWAGSTGLFGDHLIRWNDYGTGPLRLADLTTGRTREVELPASEHAGFTPGVGRVLAYPGHPNQAVVSWTLLRYEPVLSDVINVYVSDRYLGVLDLRTDTWRTVLRSSDVRGDPRLRLEGVTSWGEAVLEGGWGVDLATGHLRRFDLPCTNGADTSFALYSDRLVAVSSSDEDGYTNGYDVTWSPFALSPQ